MRSLAQLVDDGLDLLAGRRFDPDLIGGNVIDLGHHRERVTALADRLNAHRSGRPKQAVVLWTSGYSAVTKRGPWVYIARGLVDALSDDAVAFVLAHEMGHHDLRHLSPTVMIAGLLGELQRMEYQADRYALDLARRAGFDPKGGLEALDPDFWKAEPDTAMADWPPRLREWVNRFRKSHPPLELRCEALRQALAAP
ncbi:MAG: M48 family metalloprotease [Alphaproteobacteria bacterium]|nr:M48 family metalloprotease [Alphaproteobacteria bacterium]